MTVTKVTFNLPDDLLAEARAAALIRGVTVTDVLRQSLRNDLFFIKEEAKGSKVLLEKPNGKIVQIVRQ